MTVVTNEGADIYYDARGDPETPDEIDREADTVAFVNPVGYGAWVWGWQHAALVEGFETVTWDLRGTGRSDAPNGPYTVSTLASDLEAVLSDHGVADVHLVGAGLGGMVALEYANRYNRATTLTLSGTTADGDRVDADTLQSLFAPRDDPVALRASLRNAFEVDPDAYEDVVNEIVGWRRDEDAGRTGFDAQATAMRDFDLSDSLYEITTPAQVYHGVDDAVVPAEAGRDLAANLPRGAFTAVEGGHLCFVEESAAVNDALLGEFDDGV